MNRIQKWIFFCVVVFLVTNGVYYAALADHDEYKKKRWYQKIFDWDNDNHDDDDHDRGEKKRRYQKRNGNDSKHYGEHYLTPANNPIFKEECGGCHFTYQPELLPSGSWNKILEGLEDHYGEAIELDPKSKKIIAEYLKANAAEHSTAKRAVKIMRSLGSQTPLRITEIPYIQRKHHEIRPEVFKRESVGSLSNCSACHTTAEKGIYDDDYVVIPP
ncbi:diheme cytochrome c [Thermodesulfobacteriota bacterium]